MGRYTKLNRQQIAVKYRELVAENNGLRPISKAADEVSKKFIANPNAGLTSEDRALMRRATDALEQMNSNTEAMIEMSNELAYRGEKKLSSKETGE